MLDSIEFSVAKHLSDDFWQQTILRFITLRLPIDLPYDILKFRSEIDDIHVVGTLNGRVIAALVLTKADSDTVKLRSVGVYPDLQRTGVGSKLMQFGEVKAREAGFKEIVLHSRESVVRFYEKEGYLVTSTQFLEVGIPHIRMVKKLFESARA